jgi:hypothetical protein
VRVHAGLLTAGSGFGGNGGLPICNELAAMWKAEIVRRLTQCALLWRCVPTPCGSADWTMYREPRHGSRRFGVFPGSHSRKTLMGNGAPLMTLSRQTWIGSTKALPMGGPHGRVCMVWRKVVAFERHRASS